MEGDARIDPDATAGPCERRPTSPSTRPMIADYGWTAEYFAGEYPVAVRVAPDALARGLSACARWRRGCTCRASVGDGRGRRAPGSAAGGIVARTERRLQPDGVRAAVLRLGAGAGPPRATARSPTSTPTRCCGAATCWCAATAGTSTSRASSRATSRSRSSPPRPSRRATSTSSATTTERRHRPARARRRAGRRATWRSLLAAGAPPGRPGRRDGRAGRAAGSRSSGPQADLAAHLAVRGPSWPVTAGPARDRGRARARRRPGERRGGRRRRASG